MIKEFADDAAQQKNVARFRDVLKERDLPATATSFISLPPLADPKASVAGSEACRDCHAEEHKQWAASGHAHAWASLQATGSEVDATCQQCHVTGFGWQAGFVSAGRSVELTSVGCESCHGPAQAHVEDPQQRTVLTARDQCQRCHDPENSPNFEYDAYWTQILHGQ